MGKTKLTRIPEPFRSKTVSSGQEEGRARDWPPAHVAPAGSWLLSSLPPSHAYSFVLRWKCVGIGVQDHISP